MNRMTPEGKAKLEELVARVMKDGQARGIALGIINAAGEIQYENYFGYRDAENKLPITRDTIFGMASVTKSFTALSIMQMQQDGLLKVDDPVSRYIPEFTNKNQSEPVKLWHLMCHSGGYFPLPRIVVDKTAQELRIPWMQSSFTGKTLQRKASAVWQAAWIPRPVSPDVRDSA